MLLLRKRLFSKAQKTKNPNQQIKPLWTNPEFEEKAHALKLKLVEKLLVLTNGKTSQGKRLFGAEVISKGSKLLKTIVRCRLLYCTNKQMDKYSAKNEQIKTLIMNYLKK